MRNHTPLNMEQGVGIGGPVEVLICGGCQQLWPCEVEVKQQLIRELQRRIKEIIAEFDVENAPTVTMPMITDVGGH